MPELTLALRGEYFDQIVSGEKTEEYRLATPFWTKRLLGRSFSSVIVTKGYPKKTDTSRRAEFPWRGCQLKTITHPHFGPDPVKVYAIEVRH